MIGWYGCAMLCYVTPKEHLGLAIKHYQRVGRDAQSRILAIEAFKKGGYAKFQFK